MIDTETLALPKGEYYNETTTKRQICLHFTAGHTAKGAYNTFLTGKGRVGTAFAVDRDGSVYQLFDPNCWALHLYRHKKGEDPKLYSIERMTIGIEIVNIGPLVLGKGEEDKNILYAWTKKPYCTLDDVEMYHQQTYRNMHYWAAFTPAQYVAVRDLVFDLSSSFNIPIMGDTPGPALEYWSLDKMYAFYGLTNHGNYRRDKYDIGPGFDWKRIGVNRV